MSTNWTPDLQPADLMDPIPDGVPVERYVLNGETMATRWSALFYAATGRRTDRLATALQSAVDQVDSQMSTWKPDSDLMRLNRAPLGSAVRLPAQLLEVLAAAFDIGRASGDAFDVGVGDLVAAWGFGAAAEAPDALRTTALGAAARLPARDAVLLDPTTGTATKRGLVSIDLSGIAKGFGVDCLAQTLDQAGIGSYLVSIDGELRARGKKPDGVPWTVAVERPDREMRDIAASVGLEDAALATSGNYRHWREQDGRSWSHTIDPRTGRPADNGLSSVTVMAPTCLEADAWATALLVLGPDLGRQLAETRGLEALFIPDSKLNVSTDLADASEECRAMIPTQKIAGS
jgi:thiamine biosynthesis lipoprotein